MFFPWLPPEINSALMFAGAGPGPLLASATAWDALAADLAGAAASFDSVVSGLTGGPWTGPASLSMAAAAVPYVTWLNAAATQAEAASAQAFAAAAAFETAQAGTVPPAAVAANRALLLLLIATNFFGQNTAAIAATELEYMEMWAQDVAAMTGYHAGAMSVAATLPSFSAPPVGLAGLGAGLGNILSSFLSSFVSWLSGLLPVGGLAGLAGQVQTFIAGIPAVLINAVTQLPTTLSAVPLTSLASVAQVAQVGMVPASMVASPMMSLAQVANGAGLASSATTGMAAVPQFVGSSVPPISVLSGATTGLGPVGAGLGNARLVGAISVPSTWPGSMPMRMATPVTSGLGAGLPSAAAAEAAEVAPAAGTPMSPMPVGVNGMPGKTDRASPHVVPTRPTVVPRTGVG
ncbi:PPE family protein [Mycobacterium sp. IS-1264]|uniref:PPE family protein n=1 Tax=Mycobacterium sp. IS-1264 TaxID=1834158 RepID=UPI00096D05B9|nr:PPE family protein [Mycobacterium sp. IS-1264]OMC39171.1 hypothetical protein A5744_22595 [Mycobacterium sp. IS-1264]